MNESDIRKATHDYVSRADCGCVVAICVDARDKGTAKFVSDEIKKGNTIERLPAAEAVAALKGGCAQHIAERERRRAAAKPAEQPDLFGEGGR